MDIQPQSPAMPEVSMMSEPGPQRSRWLAWTIGAVVVLGLIGAGAWYMRLLPAGPSPSESPTPDTGVITPTPAPELSGSPDPRIITDLPVVRADYPSWQPDTDPSVFYRIGTVTQAPYTGADLIVAEIQCEGPCFYPMRYRFLRTSGGKIILLQKYSDIVDEFSPLNTSTYTVDATFTLAGLETPKVITAPNGATLELDPTVHQWFDAWIAPSDAVPAFTHATLGQLYTDRQDATPTPTPDSLTGAYPNYRSIKNGYYARLSDDSVAVYSLRLTTPQIVWDDGKAHPGEYEATDLGGCGSTNYAAVVPPYALNEQRDLAKTGITKAGEPVYEYRDAQHPFLRDIYDMQYAGTWIQSEGKFGNKMSYDDFVSAKPIFFWRDAFGRLIRFRNTLFASPAECGKPVIYLYPEQTSEVSVQVKPVGGMSFSEPSYGDGWTVMAQPDGALTDASGTKWPYLFWEGRGGLYEQPKKGWVVARADVERLLNEKLSAFGLIENEIADFKEFWLPRMQSAPYYFVTFLGNQAMDELAPLTVNPRPDTVIRVLMDFSPLTEPKSVTPYSIRTPARSGFTVVEWGGVIR